MAIAINPKYKIELEKARIEEKLSNAKFRNKYFKEYYHKNKERLLRKKHNKPYIQLIQQLATIQEREVFSFGNDSTYNKGKLEGLNMAIALIKSKLKK